MWLHWWWYILRETTGTTMWRCRWHWRAPKEPLCCSSGSSSCLCRTWMPSPITSTSPWSSTIMTTVRRINFIENQCRVWCHFLGRTVKTSPPALLSKSPLLTTNHQASRRESVTASGLKAWLCTSRWVRCRRPSTPWGCACQQSRAGWRSFKKGTTWGRPSRLLQEILQKGKRSRWVQKEDCFRAGYQFYSCLILSKHNIPSSFADFFWKLQNLSHSC